MELLIPILGLIGILAVIDFGVLLIDERRMMGHKMLKITETLAIFFGPLLFYFSFDAGQSNDCCSESAFFSPDYRLTIYLLILFCQGAYFYSSYRKKLSPPAVELIITCFLLIGIVLNVFIAIQAPEALYWIIGNISIIAFFFSMLLQNHRFLVAEISTWDVKRMNFAEKVCFLVLQSNFFIKYPVLLILCLPVLLLLAAIFFVFGQKPDSFIRAFTDTYKHGFSQLDYMCDNVQCGGHYLCSVAANGHKNIVKPIRSGERNGSRIICNRQLLISNAFEELIEQRVPRLHRIIRRNYDRVGDVVHRCYKIFHNKYFSDFIYVIMKPGEWVFLFVLYINDRKPENRIARQYLKKSDRIKMKHGEKENFFHHTL